MSNNDKETFLRRAFNKKGLYKEAQEQRKIYDGFSIDAKTAKLLDDGLSIKKLANGQWQIDLFIADTPLYYQEIGEKPRLKQSKRNETDVSKSLMIEYFGLHPINNNNKDGDPSIKAKPAIRLSMIFNTAGEIQSYHLDRVLFKNCYKLSFEDFERLKQDPSNDHLRDWEALAHKIQNNYLMKSDGPHGINNIIATFAGVSNALLAQHAYQHNLPIFYQRHPIYLKKAKEVFPDIEAATQHAWAQGWLGPDQKLKYGEDFSVQKSKLSTKPYGLTGFEAPYYGKFTSPMRRLTDAINLQILVAHMNKVAQPYTSQELETIAQTINEKQDRDFKRKSARRHKHAPKKRLG